MNMTLAQIAALTGAQLIGDPNYAVGAIADLESAQATDISFLANPRYAKLVERSQAGAVLVPPDFPITPERQWLVCAAPSQAFQQLVHHFHPITHSQSGFCGADAGAIHPSAVIHPSAQIDPTARIGPLCVIDREARIGANSYLVGHVWIGTHVVVGTDCTLHPHTVVREGCQLGNRCILQPGAVLGGCGYGYSSDSSGHQKLTQMGRVVLEDDVEVGSNSTIDRARFKETRIGAGTKIDNLVMIAHGVTTGQRCLIVAQSGIAGSTHLGDDVILGGQSACVGHIRLASRTTLAARGGATKSILKPGIYAGTPAIPIQTHHRQQAHLSQLETRLAALTERLAQLEETHPS